MPIITITRGKYSGGEAVAESIAKSLGARCESDEVLREAASTFHVPDEEMSQFFEKSPTFWERMTRSRHVHAAFIRASLANWCKDNNLVYHGNAGQELLSEVPHALKVRLMFSEENRVQRVMSLFGYSHEQAQKYVSIIDDDRTKRTRYYYNADWRDASRYDLVLRVDTLSFEYAERMIVDMAKQPAFQLTKGNEQAFHDFLLKSLLLAVAATYIEGDISLIDISVHDGCVLLQGSLPAIRAVAVGKMVDRLGALEGVVSLKNELSAGLVMLKR